MDILAWLWWLVLKVLGLAWALLWLLLGGWVATAAQIALLVLAVFAYKYGWRRAPGEVAARVVPLGRMAWAWLRGREATAAAGAASARAAPGREPRLVRYVRRPGDVNLSTLLNLMMLTGLGLLAVL